MIIRLLPHMSLSAGRCLLISKIQLLRRVCQFQIPLLPNSSCFLFARTTLRMRGDFHYHFSLALQISRARFNNSPPTHRFIIRWLSALLVSHHVSLAGCYVKSIAVLYHRAANMVVITIIPVSYNLFASILIICTKFHSVPFHCYYQLYVCGVLFSLYSNVRFSQVVTGVYSLHCMAWHRKHIPRTQSI